MNYLIEHQCPQCGAPALMEEADRFFSCPYCRVNSYLLGGKYFRYIFSKPLPQKREIVFFPYWRFKGMKFTCGQEGIDGRFIDFSWQAEKSLLFPISLGLRSQALKLKFIPPECPAKFVKPGLGLDTCMKNVDNRYKSHNAGQVLLNAYVGDTISMIYSPFYLEGSKIVDAVVEAGGVDERQKQLDMDSLSFEEAAFSIQFVPAICPECGWDLEGEKDSLAMLCRNCNSIWLSSEKGFIRTSFVFIEDSHENLIYLPFWRIKADVSGVGLGSYADLVKLANLPKTITPSMHDRKFHFWIQAFKVRPKLFLRLAREMTLSQPGGAQMDQIPDARIFPVTLPVTEANQALKINLAGFAKPAQRIIARIQEIEVKPASFKLVYVPFVDNGREFVQPELCLAIDKNTLALSANL